MKKGLFAACLALSGISAFAAGKGICGIRCGFDERTGGISAFGPRSGASPVKAIATSYMVLSKSGDIEAFESEDRVVERTKDRGASVFRCENPKMPGIAICKRYSIVNGGLRRTVSFLNSNRETCYVTPFTECRFAAGFTERAYHLGAGYIGPYKPFPKVEEPRQVMEYLQSSKGMVLVDPASGKGCFSHYRAKIDDTVVFPWWHSTIGRYRELHDRLWYLPDGYRMGLGTFGLFRGKSVSVTDHFTLFDGDLFTFFDDVFAKDPDFSAELKSIPPPPRWVRNVVANCDDRFSPMLPWLLKMIDGGDFMMHIGPAVSYYSWGDYRLGRGGFPTMHGGRVTDDEIKAHVGLFRDMSPRVHVSVYGIAVAAAYFTGVVKEHPEWFRVRDRNGAQDPLFPGVNLNWQTMFSAPECREWMAGMFCDFADGIGTDTFYIDETQMTNTIDWERDRITQDDDTVKFWKTLVAMKNRRGKTFFANGSGIPYVDVNYIEECRGTLKPENWRDGAGVMLGVGMMNRMRKGQRTIPLYWTPGNDYANRVLALGWIPRTHLYGFNDLAVIRARKQIGHMDPANVRYSPDWKRDAITDIESYAGRREGCGDVMISFINRGKSVSDVAVRVDMGSLGFSSRMRINVYRQRLDLARAGMTREEMLSDAEIKRNWIERGILRGSRLTDPELLYSGNASGTGRFTLDGIATNAMEQLLAVPSPVSIFSVDGQPLNGFFTFQDGIRVDGCKVSVPKGRTMEALLLDADLDFESVSANGTPVETRRVRVGGRSAILVRLGPGEWTLGWRAVKRTAEPPAALPVASGPLKSEEPLPKHIWHPMIKVDKKTDAVLPSGRIVRKLAFANCVEMSTRLQENSGLEFAAADADETNLVLTAGTTRREGEIEGMVNFAGFELAGVRSLNLRFTADFTNAIACNVSTGHAAPWAMRKDSGKVFTGIVIDYRVGTGYVKRVSLATGLPKCGRELADPYWGTGRRPDEFHVLGDWLDSPGPREFFLDLGRYAPKGWNGDSIISLGTSRIQSGRTMKLEFLEELSDRTPPDPVPPDPDAVAKKLKKLPPSVAEVRKTSAGAKLFVDGRMSNACFYKGAYSVKRFGELGCDIVVTLKHPNFAELEKELMRIHHANPNARVIVSVDLTPSRAFLEKNPDAIFTDDKGVRGRVKTSVCDAVTGEPLMAQYDFAGFGNQPLGKDETWAFSYASEAWRRHGKDVLDRLVARLKASPAGNIVIGFNFMGGMDGQYVQWEYRPYHGHFDYSEGERRALCSYLRELYGSDAALRKAWGDTSVTLSSARNPSPDEFRSREFFDDRPGFGRRLADCRRFIAVGLARSLNGFARHVKKAWGRPSVVELWWTTAIWPQPSRLAIDELTADGAVDIVKTVSYYAPERSVGGMGASANNLGASLDARGVLYVQELDHRTRFTKHVDNAAWTSAAVAKPATPEEFETQLMRDAASVVAMGGRGLCFYDMLGGWYRAKEESSIIGRVIAMQTFASGNAGLYPKPEAVILVDEQTRLLCERSVAEQASWAWRLAGYSPSIRLVSDMDGIDFPEYKLYVLWNALRLSKSQALKIRRRAEEGAMAVAAGKTGVCSRDFKSQEEALRALGTKVGIVADIGEITPETLNRWAAEAGVHVCSKPGNATYAGNGVACVHRLAEDPIIDFGREVVPFDPVTRKKSSPVRLWKPNVPLHGTAVMCYLPPEADIAR